MRWLMALVVSFAVASPATAGVFKARGGSKPAATPAKKAEPKPKAAKAAKAAKPDKAEPAEAEPDEKPAEKSAAAPAKKAPKAAAAPVKSPKKKSAVAATGRPDDLTPDAAPKKKGKGQDVAITVEDEDDVIIRDIDD